MGNFLTYIITSLFILIPVFLLDVLSYYLFYNSVFLGRRKRLYDTINLGEHIPERTTLIVGGELGKKVKKSTKIDKIEKKFDTVHIIIPDHITLISESFFEEFFDGITRKLGKNKFHEKIKFTSNNYNYSPNLNKVINKYL